MRDATMWGVSTSCGPVAVARAGALALLVAPGLAAAQSSATVAARRLLLDQASTAASSGDAAHALDLARRAGEIQMTPSLRLFLAEQERAMGRIAGAFGDADLCVREGDRDVATRNRDTVVARCRALLDDLRTHSGFVTVRVPAVRSRDVVVRVAGEPVEIAAFGIPVIVLPGEVTIEAEARGFEPLRRTVSVGQGTEVSVEIELQPSASPPSPEPVIAPPPADVVAPTVPPAQSTISPAPPHAVAPPRRGPPAGGIALVAAGGAAIVASGALFGLQVTAVGNCTIAAGSIDCPHDSDTQHASMAPSYNKAAIGTIIGGSVLLAGGLVWTLLGSVRHVERPAPIVAVVPDATGASIVAAGAF